MNSFVFGTNPFLNRPALSNLLQQTQRSALCCTAAQTTDADGETSRHQDRGIIPKPSTSACLPSKAWVAFRLNWLLLALGLSLFSTPLLADETNQPNTIVRFEFQRGTNALGIADVELFDQDKPETVRNFLLYVRSGAYTNSFLHRCVPGFIVQGGGFSVTNPTSSSQFSAYSTVTNYGLLTNEYSVGTPVSNTLATLAMAKVGNDPDSATSQWFFNLGNNSTNLDNQNGGFTVFGRVLETAVTNDGVNVLEHFNRLSTNAGIVNLGNLINSSYQVFNSLPVSYTNTVNRVPLYRELYHVRISVPNDTKPPGVSAPSVTVTSPAPNSLFTNQAVRIAGTAADDVEVARVVYRLGNAERAAATGTTNWEVTLLPQLGFNTVTVESIDWDGNYSPGVPVTFFYQRTMPLELQSTGLGTVAGLTNGQVLSAGATYTATATPLGGHIFEGWTGSITSSTPTLTFQAPTNATNFTLAVKFLPDPLPTLTGTYNGLFLTLGSPDFDAAAFMSLTLQSDGSFTGSILYHGVTYYYSQKFDSEGNATIGGLMDGVTRTISLTFQKLNPSGLITGNFSGTSTSTFVQLERLAAALPTDNAPPPGKYTFVIPAISTNPPTATIPGGNGYGTGTITPGGTFALTGVLGDGTPFTASPKITSLGKWPLYLTLDGGKGALWGWITFNTNQPKNLLASLTWIRTANGAVALYPAGVTNQVTFSATHYVPPQPGTRVLNWVHGLARLTGTDLVPSLTNVVKLSTNNTFEVLEPNAGMFRLTLDQPSGLVNGSFVHPWFGTTNLFQGAVLGSSNYIRGQYTSGSQIGSLQVDVTPFLVTQSVASVTLPALTAALSEGGVLQFQGDGVIVLTNALVPSFDTRLEANGHSVVISGGGTNRLVEVRTNLAFSAVGMIFADGFHQGAPGTNGPAPGSGSDGLGAGILSLGGPVGFTNCIITNCVVLGGDAGWDSSSNGVPAIGGRALGAAIYSRGSSLTLQNCTIADNLAVGGGNRSLSTTGLISQGNAMGMGAGLFSEAGECRVIDSTFVNNRAQGGTPLPLSPTGIGRAGNAVGGAIAVAGGTLRLTNSMILTNTASASLALNSAGSGHGFAGGLFVESNVVAVVEHSLFAGNSARAGNFNQTLDAPDAKGGAIFNAGSLSLTNCSLERNTAYGGSSGPAGSGWGGALLSLGPLVVNGSTFSDNIAQGGEHRDTPASAVAGGEGAGGAIYANANTVAITNSTFTFNRAIGGSGADPSGQTNVTRGTGRGGALVVTSNSAVLVNVTLAFNEAVPGQLGTPVNGDASGGGLANVNGTLTLRSSIVASNTPANFIGGISDLGYNISSDSSVALTGTGSLTNTDPALVSLSTNGGPTRTMAILPQSPARDLVRGSHPVTDQRGILRPQGTFADSGAFEFAQTLPLITLQPSGTNVARLGTNVTFQALASGPQPIGYYWLKDELPLAGRVTSVLTLTNVQPPDAGRYAAVATNSFGAVTSSVATLVIDLRPVILTQPGDVVVSPGVSTSLVVTATGPALSYSWLHNQIPVPDATNATYVLNNAAAGIEGTYQVIITNDAGAVTSRIASVTWSSATLAILTQPLSQTVEIGRPSTFNVLASGVAPISYQWLKDNVPVANATNNVLSFPSTARTSGGGYRVVVSNPFVMLTSSNAVLTVVAAPVLSINFQGASPVAITCLGDPGRVHRLLSGTNLAVGSLWITVATSTMPGNGSVTWSLPASTNPGPVYFRAVTP